VGVAVRLRRDEPPVPAAATSHTNAAHGGAHAGGRAPTPNRRCSLRRHHTACSCGGAANGRGTYARLPVSTAGRCRTLCGFQALPASSNAYEGACRALCDASTAATGHRPPVGRTPAPRCLPYSEAKTQAPKTLYSPQLRTSHRVCRCCCVLVHCVYDSALTQAAAGGVCSGYRVCGAMSRCSVPYDAGGTHITSYRALGCRSCRSRLYPTRVKLFRLPKPLAQLSTTLAAHRRVRLAAWEDADAERTGGGRVAHGRYELGLQEAGGLTRRTFVIFFLAFTNLYAVRHA
jgi:hypothetical protein